MTTTATKKATASGRTANRDKKIDTTPGRSNRRPDIEKYLDDKGVKWEYHPTLAYDDIDLERSLRNQARIHHKVDEEVVTRYTDAMERGDVFPPVITAKGGRTADAKQVNIDGNHRIISGTKRGGEVYPYGAYEVLSADPQIIVLMTFEANTKHGLPTSEEERVHQAIWLIDNGASHQRAAEAVNVPIGAIKRLWNKVQADRRADEVGMVRSHWDHLSNGIKQRLLTVSTDEGFAALAELAFKAKLDTDEVNKCVAEINQSRSGVKQRAMVANWTEVYADRVAANLGGMGTSNSKKGQTPKQRYLLTIGNVLSLPDDPVSLAAQFAPQERSEAASRARDAEKRFRGLAEALEG